ncbi:HaeIII restriction endonuclease [Caldicellulosiruptor bescii]|uniref:Type II site-specific deoxyribonuclease n=2 Tax=Caldicellulosiruptor bescii TaxID=31899 RepID=B9MNH5_CALBD|nr:HaeIII family restriction endonuclease [Caldicellulosiruptor bescii]ACM61506.1 Type II site-specific deoxyribonuclease [Caldicellulosiruptor bescii DSM 6725]PBC88683.1 HaeIII restriction endonuclease [Caldicellulosiruptor bescii]PBC91836.1 HaeIII restriction endonuclease [Caldicellulosiruptor bescii]PBD02753.1 HaeIII restriction endonuclease [Caldicellulosiruptor bescii]PBD07631.1 HaeIII restriction endonuclease [Caldicellulosiruptor bescii]
MDQTAKGKAFEYACIIEFENYLKNEIQQKVVIQETRALKTAERLFLKQSDEEQKNMLKAANAAAKIISKCEPHLVCKNHTNEIILRLQEDAAGQRGDVRDMLAIRILEPATKWEIGISCKHNHLAVKHPRLSPKLDFGKRWLGIPCSQNYFDEIKKVFSEIEIQMREKKCWNEIEEKEEMVYVPLLNAFVKELIRIEKENKGLEETIPSKLLKYLLGKNDFYKVISLENTKSTMVQAFNLNGLLNQPCCDRKPEFKIGPKLKLPTKFQNIYFKEDSKNTVHVVCDNGWTISFRLHNASSKLELSLKFDIQLVGHPQKLFSHIESWE